VTPVFIFFAVSFWLALTLLFLQWLEAQDEDWRKTIGDAFRVCLIVFCILLAFLMPIFALGALAVATERAWKASARP
jgi:hypothetical protein